MVLFKVRVNERKSREREEKKQQSEVESCETKTSKASRCVTKFYLQKKTNKSSAYQLRRKRDLIMFTGEKERERERKIHTGLKFEKKREEEKFLLNNCTTHSMFI